MLAAVNLHHQPTLYANEVHNKPSYGILPPELETIRLAKAEASPQMAFGISGIVSKLACSLSPIALHYWALFPLQSASILTLP